MKIICLDKIFFFLLYINYIALRRYPSFHKNNINQQSNGIFSNNNDNQAQEIFLIIKPIITTK